ncbi:MAG: N-formylglutamate amidohydrolase [Pseudomonadota bacterium]
MDSQASSIDFGDIVHVTGKAPAPQALIVCEHASNRIPEGLDTLGLGAEAQASHVAWDPGALGVAERLSALSGGVLVSAAISRLVYDCNRPPEAESAIPKLSEVYEIPGNAHLSAAARAERVSEVYAPFESTLAATIAGHRDTLSYLVTVHSFTPIFHGVVRSLEIGVLHGQDARLAAAMLADVPSNLGHAPRLNEPYDASDGVTHTLDLHGAANGLLNVMIELRNDLIRTPAQQKAMADRLAPWIASAVAACRAGEAAS